jgi:hypothetical protein
MRSHSVVTPRAISVQGKLHIGISKSDEEFRRCEHKAFGAHFPRCRMGLHLRPTQPNVGCKGQKEDGAENRRSILVIIQTFCTPLPQTIRSEQEDARGVGNREQGAQREERGANQASGIITWGEVQQSGCYRANEDTVIQPFLKLSEKADPSVKRFTTWRWEGKRRLPGRYAQQRNTPWAPRELALRSSCQREHASSDQEFYRRRDGKGHLKLILLHTRQSAYLHETPVPSPHQACS